MDIYESEKEQVEAIKKWWKDNGKSVVAGLVIGLGGVFGWTSWQSYRAAQAEQASSLYQQVVNAAEAGLQAEFQRSGEQLLSEFPDNAYASLGALVLANSAYRAGQPAEAKARLTWVVEHAPEAELRLIAQLRLARLMLDEQGYDAAIAVIDQAKPNSHFAPLFEELRGDVRVAQGRPDEARPAYTAALEALAEDAPARPRVQMKLDDLGRFSVPPGPKTADNGQ